MNDDLERRLDEWGRAPVPDPAPSFVDDLERDLRSQAFFSTGDPTPRGRTRVLRPALVMGTVLLVALGAWLAVRGPGSGRAEVVMSEAMGTLIELPGGAATAAEPGAVLPDGTRISVDRAGSAVVDGVVLGGGTEAVVVDGRIEILITDPTSTPAPAATGIPDEPATSTPGPNLAAPPASPRVTDATSEPTNTPPERPTASDDVRPTPRPTPDPTTRPTPRPTPTAALAEATPTATPEPAEASPSAIPADQPETIDITLDIVRLGPRRGLLTWRAPQRDDIRGWEVVTITGDRVRTIAVLRDPGIRSLRVERPRNVERAFVIRARGADGVILGESNGVRFPTAS